VSGALALHFTVIARSLSETSDGTILRGTRTSSRAFTRSYR